MNTNTQTIETLDVQLFNRNSGQFTREQLAPYRGQNIAWSFDGTRIVASGQSQEEVDQKLADLGIHFSQVVHDYVDDL